MVLPAAYDVPLCPVDASMTAKTHKIGIATVSLGWHHSHTLERKLDSIAKQGYHGVEIYYQDLVDFARQNSLTQLQAASKVGALCKEKAISIIALQPLFDFAGVSTKLQWRLEKAREYILLARAMGTNMIQVPTTYEPNSIGDETVVVEELSCSRRLGQGGTRRFLRLDHNLLCLRSVVMGHTSRVARRCSQNRQTR